ncbi:MAG: esterase/lipase family protein [Leptolyngbyaceae cyanobacterium]
MAPHTSPILLLHGIDDTIAIFDKMKAYLGRLGCSTIHTLNLSPNNGDAGLDSLAEQVRYYIEQFLPDAPFIDIVGFSMGGMVGRYYVQRLGGLHRVRRFITLSSPHNGTWTGYLRANLGASQMRPNSAFLKDLNSTVDELRQIEFISIWTPYDLMILPANSSQLSVGKMVQLPILTHPLMVSDERSLSAVAGLLMNPVTAERSSTTAHGM